MDEFIDEISALLPDLRSDGCGLQATGRGCGTEGTGRSTRSSSGLGQGMHGLPWDQRGPARPDSKRYGNLVPDRSIGEIPSGHSGEAGKQPFGIPHGNRRAKDTKRFRAGLLGRLVCRARSRSRRSHGQGRPWKKERSSTTKDALHAMGRTGRAIVWFADLLCNGWRGGIFWNK